MYALGHLGCALLVYAPIAAALTATAEFRLAMVTLGVAVALSTLPDIDQPLPIDHRGPTHTIWFVTIVATVVTAIAYVVGVGGPDPITGALIVGLVALLSLCSHLLADSITPMGISPFAPVSDWHHSFEIVPARHRIANAALFSVGTGTLLIVQIPFII